MKYISFFKICLLISIIFISTSLVISQDNKKDTREQNFKKRWERIEELKKLKMLEDLNLSEEESQKFLSRYVSFRKQTREIEKERSGLLGDLETIMKSGGKQPEISKKIEDIEAVDQKMFNNRRSFIEDIKTMLPIEKTAKYILFERNFQREIQSILQDVQKQRFRSR